MNTFLPSTFDWKQTVQACLQEGGKLVFISSRTPENFQEWIGIVTTKNCQFW